MGKRHLTLLLICLLLFCGGLAWAFLGRFLQAPPGNHPNLATSANEDDTAQDGDRPADQPVRRPAGNGPRVRNTGTGDTAGAPVDDSVAPANPESQDWVLKGRLGSVVVNGRDILGLTRLDEIPWSLAWFDFDNKEATDVFWASTQLGTNRELTGAIPRASLTAEVAARAWWAPGLDLGEGNPLQAVVDADPRPDPATVKALLKPVIRGNVIDFGTIRLVVDEPGKDGFVLIGRVLGPGDVPLCSFAEYFLQGGDPDQPAAEAYFRANGQGRFATFCWLPTEDAADADAHPEAMQWHFSINDDQVIYDFGSEVDRLERVHGGPIALPAPTRTGCVLDFGDIRLPGVLLEVTCEITGVAASAPADDPFLGEPEALSVNLDLTCGDNDFSTRTAPGLALRMVVPEGRYRWSAWLDHPEVCCAPPFGNFAARAGQRATLRIVFAPLPLTPVKVLDPQGNPLADATVNWSIEANEDDWIEGSAVKGNLVPMLAGKETYVVGLHPRYEQVDTTAEAGAKEVILQFTTEGTSAAGSVTLILPKLPAEFGVARLVVQFSMESDQYRSYGQVRLSATEQIRHPISGLPYTTFTATLKMGGSYGYPDGVLSVLKDFVVTAGADTEVEFPAIAAPPLSVPIGKCTAQITVAGEAAALRGPWEYEARTSNQEIANGDVILRGDGVKEGVSGGQGLIPTAFAPRDQRFPATMVPPAAAWGEAFLRLDLPSRLHVRVQRRGQPVEAFSARLEDSANNTMCRVGATLGSARLWAPGNRVRLVVELEHNANVVADIELGPVEKEHVVELDWVKVVFHQQGENQALWGIAPSANPDDVNVLAVNQELMLSPVKYRVRPQRDVDQSAAFELDLTDGKDREIDLPGVQAAEQSDIVLHMAESDWDGFRFAQFWYWAPSDGIDHPQTAEFIDVQRELNVREMPDAIVLRGVPLNRQILLQGVIYRRDSQGRNRPWFLKPISFKAGKENKFTPQWIKGVGLHEEWQEVFCRCVSAFSGYWTNFSLDDCAPVGRHELVFLDGDGAESFRAVVDVPAATSEFRIPAEIRARLEQAGVLSPEEPPDPDDS